MNVNDGKCGTCDNAIGVRCTERDEVRSAGADGCESHRDAYAIALVKRNQSLDGLQVLTFEFGRRADVEAVLGAFVGASARYRTRGPAGEVHHYAVWLAEGVVVQEHPTDDRREPIEAPECAPYTVEVPL